MGIAYVVYGGFWEVECRVVGLLDVGLLCGVGVEALGWKDGRRDVRWFGVEGWDMVWEARCGGREGEGGMSCYAI